MTAPKNIEIYLNQLANEGTLNEVSGFTLDQESAVRKLSTNQLPEPALWIVKMVQAAVRGEATGIDVRLGRNVLQVQFDSELLPTASQLVEHLYSGQLSTDPFLLHLSTGLRTAIAQPQVSFVMETVGPTGREVVVASGEQQARFQEPEPTLGSPRFTFLIRRPYRTPGFKKALDREVTQLIKGTAEEHTALLTRCWPSPVPIRIDGKQMDTRYDSPLMFRSSLSNHKNRMARRGLFPRINFYLRYYPPEEGKPALVPDRYGAPDRHRVALGDGETALLEKPVYLDGRFFEWTYSGERAGQVLVSPLGTGRRHAIYFIQDGAMVQRVPVALCPPQKFLGTEIQAALGGDCLIVPVDFDDLDLSQFRVRDAACRRDKLVGWMIAEGHRSSVAVAEHFKHLYWFSNSRTATKAGAALVGLATLPLGLAFGPMVAGSYALFQTVEFGWTGLFARSVVSRTLKQSNQLWEKTFANLDPATIDQPPIE